MTTIDLTQQIYSGMPVFPGDPEVVVEDIQEYSKDGWNMKRLHINLHDGTHVNVPIHGTSNGVNLDAYSINDFIGESVLYESVEDIKPNVGIIFSTHDLNREIAEIIVKQKPKFVGLSDKFEFDIEIEKYLLENGIISFEKLTNTDKLPKYFTFYGVPLNIKQGDGSPVRAFATF